MMTSWQINGFKSQKDALIHVLKTLKEDEKTIVGRGTTPECTVVVGNYQLILKRKK